jgi:1-acyl-sn-glycerol-3-phosphate acyltransferase
MALERDVVMQRLNWCWRVAMTGWLFVLFGLGGFLMALFGFNLLNLTVRDRLRRRNLARRAVSASFRFFLRHGRWLGVFDYHFENSALLREERGTLIVANHPTLLDYVFIASQMPQVGCLVKASLTGNIFMRGVIRAADYLINSQGETLLAESRQRLAEGESILIFPEGTRTRPGQPFRAQRGAANIAVRSGCPLRLVHIDCNTRWLDKQSRWYQVPARKPKVVVSVRSRIDSRIYLAGDEASSRAARRLTRYLEQALPVTR